MASMDSNISPLLLQMVRNDLFQLHCKNVIWEKTPDKIPAEVASYLLGRSCTISQYCGFSERKYMFVHIRMATSPTSSWGQPDPNYRKEDVWEIGRLQPQEHPEILYLLPSLIGSTPKKASTQSRGNPPEIEDMEQHELVGLVKKLTEERNSKPPIPTPVKDTTVAGHVSMNQESFVQSSQAILQGLAEGGYIHTKTPKFEFFFGDEKILICGKDKFYLQLPHIQVQLSNKQ